MAAQQPPSTHTPRPASANEPNSPAASFAPFFTLVTNARTSTTHHPTVHYIFSTDDGEALTDAALRIESAHARGRSRTGHAQQPPAAAAEPDERFVVVNLTPDGRGVESAHSMTGGWRVTGTELSRAPTLEEGPRGEGPAAWVAGGAVPADPDGGLMLRIQGTEGPGGVGVEEGRALGLEGLVEEFRVRMEELRGLVEGREGERV